MEGKIDLKTSGALDLIDDLLTVGLLSNEQRITASAMVLSLTRRDEKSDALISTIEVKPGGSVLVNGLPLPWENEQ